MFVCLFIISCPLLSLIHIQIECFGNPFCLVWLLCDETPSPTPSQHLFWFEHCYYSNDLISMSSPPPLSPIDHPSLCIICLCSITHLIFASITFVSHCWANRTHTHTHSDIQRKRTKNPIEFQIVVMPPVWVWNQGWKTNEREGEREKLRVMSDEGKANQVKWNAKVGSPLKVYLSCFLWCMTMCVCDCVCVLMGIRVNTKVLTTIYNNMWMCVCECACVHLCVDIIFVSQ